MSDIIEVLPKTKNETDEYLEAKICIDAVESGNLSDEFLDLISKDLGLPAKKKDSKMAKDSLWSKIKSLVFDNKIDRTGREHDDKGLFTGLSKKSKDILGEQFIGYKGKDAIDKLMIEKRGHIIDAFHRDDIGGIALIWGDEERGLAHIIMRRKKLNQPLGKLLSSLPEVIEKGTLTEEDGDFSIIYKGKKVVVEPKLFNDKFQFLMTAYYEGIKSPQRGVY